MKSRMLSVIVCCLGFAGALFGVPYFVAPTGSDANDGMNWETPLATISAALAMSDVTLVLVSNGTYTLTSTITHTKAATIRGVNTPGQTNTIIDGAGAYGCFVLDNASAVLENLVITNGYAVAGAGVLLTGSGGIVTNCLIVGNRIGGSTLSHGGGGIYCDKTGAVYNSRIIGNSIVPTNALPRGGGVYLYQGGLIDACLVAENTCTNTTIYVGGGGIHIYGSGGLVRNSTISNNLGMVGGGITMRGGVVTGCMIAANRSLDSAGGFYIREAGSHLVVDCVISNNETSWNGGGVYMNMGSTAQVLRDCTITHNRSVAKDGGGVYIGGDTGVGLIDGCTIEYNQSLGVNDGGGGVYVTRASGSKTNVQILNSTIRFNSSTVRGGGVYFRDGGVIVNSLVMGNTSSLQGGGLYIRNSNTDSVYSCTFADNRGSSGGGIYVENTNSIFNTIVWSNRADAATNNDVTLNSANYQNSFYYCCASRDLSGVNQNNITNHPMFASCAAYNFRLLPDSPCINAGINQPWMADAMDLDGRPRIDRVVRCTDMGCYERIPEVTLFKIR